MNIGRNVLEQILREGKEQILIAVIASSLVLGLFTPLVVVGVVPWQMPVFGTVLGLLLAGVLRCAFAFIPEH